MEEFVASYGDDDTDFVGSVDAKTGLFTPASDGPDPKRKSMRNNYGDVWITATYKTDGVASVKGEKLPGGCCAAVHLLGSAGGSTVTMYSLGEFHKFQGAGQEFLYLVPSGGIVALDGMTTEILQRLDQMPLSREDLVAGLCSDGYASNEVEDCIDELREVKAIRNGKKEYARSEPLPETFPLQTIVLNVTNQCNLSCQYCYEFGEDKVATPDGKPKFMEWETAKSSVDYLFAESQGRKSMHITFFGGETLMNFPLLKRVVEYSRAKAEELQVKLDFSLTTNATLLTPAIIEYLAENAIGVTVSMDGPKEMQDKFRVFANGRGSYDIIKPKVQNLLAKHKTRPIAARVTMTSGAMDVRKIYQHLKHELGFYEVGFAPVTTSPTVFTPSTNREWIVFWSSSASWRMSILSTLYGGSTTVFPT